MNISLRRSQQLTSTQVWSFSPPDDEFEDFRSGSPASLPDHAMEYDDRPRPHSAALPSTLSSDPADVTMADAGDTCA
jgi:F-box and WD-40 domain protein CDC4